MSFRVDLTYRAERDVDHILSYLTKRSPQGATTWADRWDEVLSDLATNARQKSLAPENDDHDEVLHHVVFKTRHGRKYRAIFVIRGNLVFVPHVRGPGQDRVPPDEMSIG